MRCQYKYVFAVNAERQCDSEAIAFIKYRENNETESRQMYICTGHLRITKHRQHVESVKEIDSRLTNLE